MDGFPRALGALRRIEGGAWPFADALIEEVQKTEAGNARQGEWPRAQRYFAEHGFEVGEQWLKDLHSTAKWASADRSLETTIRGYSLRSVKAARQKARGDHAAALAILEEHGGRLHAIAGTHTKIIKKQRPSKPKPYPKLVSLPDGQEHEYERNMAIRPSENDDASTLRSISNACDKMARAAEAFKNFWDASRDHLSAEGRTKAAEIMQKTEGRVTEIFTSLYLAELSDAAISADVAQEAKTTKQERETAGVS